ncbi:translation initiation factor 3 subunit I [Nematocida sp. AWRm77]|nr:translation initiation factor 3 subunit I [Nematocida sp. AWRm77]
MFKETEPALTEEQKSFIEPSANYQIRYHLRPITEVKFNHDGDLLFSASKAETAAVWRVETGKRMVEYRGHSGAVMCLDVDRESKRLATGGADGKCILWDVDTGKTLCTYDNLVTTKDVTFTPSGEKLLMCTDAIMGQPPKILMYDVKSGELIKEYVAETIATSVASTLDEDIVYSDTTGKVALLERRTFGTLSMRSVHQSKITSLSSSFCGTYFVTGSNDFKSKIVDVSTGSIEVVREFLSDSPINTAKVSPNNAMVVTAGGIDARDVTTKGGKGKFYIEFFDCVTSKLLGYYSEHFGTINTLDIHPSGGAIASGAEDGVVNVLRLDDPTFLSAPFTMLPSLEAPLSAEQEQKA